MGGAIVFQILFYIIVGWVIWWIFKQSKRGGNYQPNVKIDVDKAMDQVQNLWAKVTLPIVIVVIGIIVLLRVIVIVPAGATGVFVLFGQVDETPLSSGINFINPLGKVIKLTIRTEEYTMSIATAEGQIRGDDSISALTSEGLEVKLDLTVLYHLDETKAPEIYREVGLNFVEKVIRPSIRSIIRGQVSNYQAREIYADKREEISVKIAEQLEMGLGTRGIILEDVLLRNVVLPPKLAQSIQDKLTADQEAQRYDFVIQKEKKEAERKRIEAEGQRDAQQIINQSLTEKYLEYLYINSLKDREGTIYVPVSPDNGLPLFRNVP